MTADTRSRLCVWVSICVCPAVPRVRSKSRSHTAVVGSQLELQCRIWGWPVPRVTWQRLGSRGQSSRAPLDFATDQRLSLRPGVAIAPPGLSVDNATLVINDVKYSDRDVYVCDVTSYVNGSWRTDNSTVLVRVKGEHCLSVTVGLTITAEPLSDWPWDNWPWDNWLTVCHSLEWFTELQTWVLLQWAAV